MSVTLKQVEKILETFIPSRFAEEWDNSGFNVNVHNQEVTGIMICLDISLEVIAEAVRKKCNLIVSHHPLLFRAIKTIDSDTYEGKCLHALLKHEISLYCAHTSADSAPGGINTWLADQFNLENRCYVEPSAEECFYEVAVHVPKEYADTVRTAMMVAGAGKLGDYTDCTYNIEGSGTFRPNKDANPFIGDAGKLEYVTELRISAICGEGILQKVLDTIKQAHPYEEPAISVFLTKEPKRTLAGLGMVGDLPQEMTVKKLMDILKVVIHTDTVRVAGELGRTIKKIGICGGAAGEFVNAAKELGAELYITGEIKHNYYAAREGIVLVEAGHFDTEKCFCELYAQGLQKLLDDVNYKIAIYVEKLQRPYINY